MTVTAYYSNNTSAAVTTYTLSGDLTAGESVITVSYTEGGVTKTDTFDVTVLAEHPHIWGDWYTKTPATCTEAEVEERECTAVSPSHHEVRAGDPAIGHDWETVPSTATVTEDGHEGRVCNNNHAHDELTPTYATGTAGLAFEGIPNNTSPTAWRVRRGSVTTGEVHIPAMRRLDADSDYLPVTEIGATDNTNGNGAFQGVTGITSITIGANVTTIGAWAFGNCTALTGVTIPASVTIIGQYAFRGCNSLTSITIPASVTSIDNFAFASCNNLASVTFEGTIANASFGTTSSFPGDLRAKYLAAGGGIGTYTTTAPVTSTSVWTKQP